MDILNLLAVFAGGLFFANAIPHLVKGITGTPFQTMFAKPPGIGLSTPIVNIVWASINIVLFYVFAIALGRFNLQDLGQAIAFGLAMLLAGLGLAHHFTRLYPEQQIRR